MKSGYHQVEMSKRDKAEAAFTYCQGQWQFRVIPFGLCNELAAFEKLMETVLQRLQWRTVPPKNMGWNILNVKHNNLTGGNLRSKKTLSRLRQRCY